MIVSLQTHFNAWVDPDTLKKVRDLEFGMGRVDVQTMDIDPMLELVHQTMAANLRPLVVVSSVEQINALPSGIDIEWLNEVNINLGRPPLPVISAEEYRTGAEAATAAALARGITPWIGGIANTNSDGFKWLERIQPYPEGAKIVIHRYPVDFLGIPTIMRPHKGFRSREQEVDRLRELIGNRDFGVSETGWPTSGFTDEEARDYLVTELKFWDKHGAKFVNIYQLQDGETNEPIDQFGIRNFERTRWKKTSEVAQLFLKGYVMPDVPPVKPPVDPPVPPANPDPWEAVKELQAQLDAANKKIADLESQRCIEVHEALSRKTFIEHPEHKGKFTCPHWDGGVVSMQPDGRVESRPKGTAGAWETFEHDGQKAIFSDVIAGRHFAILTVP